MKTHPSSRRYLLVEVAINWLMVLQSLPLAAQTLPKAKPEDVGLSTKRLQRINPVMQAIAE